MRYTEEFNRRRKAAREKMIAPGICKDPGTALVMLFCASNPEAANDYLLNKVEVNKVRDLDVGIYYTMLGVGNRNLSGAARAHLEALCNRHYNARLPSNVDLNREFNPWDYQLCGVPTENHLFNHVANRLAETIIFPDRVFSDGHTSADYRHYWEDAYRQLVAARLRHGFREWRSSIYCHVLFDGAVMLYNLLPPGPTRDAAQVLLDTMFLEIAVALRGHMWTGPHSRVYNHRDLPISIFRRFSQCYSWFAEQILQEKFIPGIAVSDYIIPEAIVRLPFRQDRYVSIEKTGPRFYPRGEGADRFNPGCSNIYICRSDREDWGGEGLIYNYLTPRFNLAAVQDWGRYDGEWHMHCIPWAFMLNCDDYKDAILSFTGSEVQSDHQGGFMTWHNHDNDQDATIFQHRKTLFSQMRGWRQEKIYEVLWDGFPEAPWAPSSGGRRFLGYFGQPESFATRFFIAESMPILAEQNGWIMGEKKGVCYGIRAVRGKTTLEPPQPGIEGRVYVCEIDDDVILFECAEIEECGDFNRFREKLAAAPLAFDARRITFRNLEGDILTFCWKEDGDPTVNGAIPDLGRSRFDDPCVRSAYDSGVIKVDCEGKRVVLDASDHFRIRRIEGSAVCSIVP